jgi:hypothetical protein
MGPKTWLGGLALVLLVGCMDQEAATMAEERGGFGGETVMAGSGGEAGQGAGGHVATGSGGTAGALSTGGAVGSGGATGGDDPQCPAFAYGAACYRTSTPGDYKTRDGHVCMVCDSPAATVVPCRPNAGDVCVASCDSCS